MQDAVGLAGKMVLDRDILRKAEQKLAGGVSGPTTGPTGLTRPPGLTEFGGMSDAVRIVAPAKINLHLRVGPVRPDGFHPLLTWMVTVGLADGLSISAGAAGTGVVLTCDDPALPTDGRNLVVKAILALCDRAGRPADVAVHLRKAVPAGGGLGGGSSDAAHALVAVADRLGVTDRAVLAAVAAGVGSDVPFFLYGPSSVCRGRGEAVRPVPPPARARHAVLVLPAVAVPTADAYRTFDRMGLGSDIEAEPDWPTWVALPADGPAAAAGQRPGAAGVRAAAGAGDPAGVAGAVARPTGADEREREHAVHAVRHPRCRRRRRRRRPNRRRPSRGDRGLPGRRLSDRPTRRSPYARPLRRPSMLGSRSQQRNGYYGGPSRSNARIWHTTIRRHGASETVTVAALAAQRGLATDERRCTQMKAKDSALGHAYSLRVTLRIDRPRKACQDYNVFHSGPTRRPEITL